MTTLAGLREALDGELFTPETPGYEAVRRPANPHDDDAQPRLVIRCGSAADGLATIGAGARLAQVYAGLHERGRTLPAGDHPLRAPLERSARRGDRRRLAELGTGGARNGSNPHTHEEEDDATH